MKTSDFDYELPSELIAQEPAGQRDRCRLLVMDRETGELEDRIFRDILDYVQPGDVMVVNETRVMPARLLGAKHGSSGSAEVFLLREVFNREPKTSKTAIWEVLVRPGRRLKPSQDGNVANPVVDFHAPDGALALQAEIIDWGEGNERGGRIARLTTPLPSLDDALHLVGRTPLPPYIKGYAGSDEMYQTVYSRRESSAAAPTAGLHFTPELISELKARGVIWQTVELEVGLDTFRIVDEENAEDHRIHTEFYTVGQETADAVNEARAAGRRVFAVGTTSVRSLESAWSEEEGKLVARDREATSLYIMPGYEFHAIDALITNFHVPRSTLMMLVSAFSSRDNVMAAYQHAIAERYRFFSFGDAMLLCSGRANATAGMPDAVKRLEGDLGANALRSQPEGCSLR